MSNHDTLWVVRLADNGGTITTVKEEVARKHHADTPGSTLAYRPFPSTVKLPFIGKGDYEIVQSPVNSGAFVATHLPTGVTGVSDDTMDAYRCMLRALTDHLERQTETVVS